MRYALLVVLGALTPAMIGAQGPGATKLQGRIPAEAIPTSLTTSLPHKDTPGAVAGVATPPTESSADSARKAPAAAWSADFLKKYADPAARTDLRAFELVELAVEGYRRLGPQHLQQ